MGGRRCGTQIRAKESITTGIGMRDPHLLYKRFLIGRQRFKLFHDILVIHNKDLGREMHRKGTDGT